MTEIWDEDLFPPSLQAAQERLGAVHPYEYAQTRNHLQGAVTRLSPYLTHGLLSVPQVAADLYRRHRLGVQNKLIFELGWREYYQHVFTHRGEGIYQSLHEGPLPEPEYAQSLPEDVHVAATGVPVIDQAVRTLYATGYLHNHARLWLASYLVHIRKVHWRVGADWLYSHLLDGDVASNHLSWQWVAGTASAKPYLFNAESVAQLAPSEWHSPNTVIDKSPEVIEMIAHSRATFTQKLPHVSPVTPPVLHTRAPAATGFGDVQADAIRGRVVWLVHPWSLGEPPPELPADALVVAVCWQEALARHPWSAARWHFVSTRMHQMTSLCWFAQTAQLVQALSQAQRVHACSHVRLPVWAGVPWQWHAPALLWPVLEDCMPSFSQWWAQVNRNGRNLGQLLRAAQAPA